MKKECFKGCFCSNEGFTLIELLVVVLIIGILAAVAVPQYQLAVLKSRYTQLQTMVRAIKKAEVAYYLAHGDYDATLKKLDIEIPSSTDYAFEMWANGDKTQVVFFGKYKGVLGYYESPKGGRQCRAQANDKLAKSVCLSLGGQYIDTYDGELAYKLP